jgi:hypothetical protein
MKPTPPTKIKTIRLPAPPARVIMKTKTVRVDVREQPTGYVSRDQCYSIRKGMKLRDLLWQYGWPNGMTADDSYAGYMMYPLVSNHDKICMVDLFDGRVDNVSVDT